MTKGSGGGKATGGGSSTRRGGAEEVGGGEEDIWGFVETGEGRGGTEGVEGERVGRGLQRFGIGRDGGASSEADEVGSGEARSQRSVGRDEEGTGARGLYFSKSDLVLLSVLTDNFDRRTTAIGARSHPESSGATAGRMTSSARSAYTTTDRACLPMRCLRVKNRPSTPHPSENDAEWGLLASGTKPTRSK